MTAITPIPVDEREESVQWHHVKKCRPVLQNAILELQGAARTRLETISPEELLKLQGEIAAYKKVIGVLYRKDEPSTPYKDQ